MPGHLVFIDTNIFLDFYRLGESAERVLPALKRHDKVLIRTEQVRIEFLKNRQKVILDNLRQVPGPHKINLPSIFADTRTAQELSRTQIKAKEHYEHFLAQVERILTGPARNDMVYIFLSDLFSTKRNTNLDRFHPSLREIRGRGITRFQLGYPPRKSSDNCCGDAVNWEWIIDCANEAKANVVLVSRDTDYGVIRGGRPILNDFLEVEFRERVAKDCHIYYTNKLTEALRILEEPVDKKDIEQEEDLIKENKTLLNAFKRDVASESLYDLLGKHLTQWPEEDRDRIAASIRSADLE